MDKVSTFASRLRNLLDTMHMTQAEASRQSGISESSISHYLKGDWEGKQDVVYSLANIFHVSEAWLMGYDVPMEKAPNPQGKRSDDDPDIRRIERARKNMPEKDKKRMMKILEASFEDYFSDSYKDDDVDE